MYMPASHENKSHKEYVCVFQMMARMFGLLKERSAPHNRVVVPFRSILHIKSKHDRTVAD